MARPRANEREAQRRLLSPKDLTPWARNKWGRYSPVHTVKAGYWRRRPADIDDPNPDGALNATISCWVPDGTVAVDLCCRLGLLRRLHVVEEVPLDRPAKGRREITIRLGMTTTIEVDMKPFNPRGGEKGHRAR